MIPTSDVTVTLTADAPLVPFVPFLETEYEVVSVPSEYFTYVFVHKYCPALVLGTLSLQFPDGTVVPELLARYVTDFSEMVTLVPVAPVFATAKLNFLLIVTPSAVIGIVASQAAVIFAVVVNVIVGVAVPLLLILALIPDGHAIVPTVTF
jgi:hypothetical protein